MIREFHWLFFSMWVAKTKITSENRRNKSYFKTHKYKALSLVSLETTTTPPQKTHIMKYSESLPSLFNDPETDYDVLNSAS